MKIKTLSLFLFILFSGASFSQNLPVDISDFRLPNLKRHEAAFGLNFNGRNMYNQNSAVHDSLENSAFSDNSFGLRPDLSYRYFFNSEKRQSYINVQSDWNLSASSSERENEYLYESQNNNSFSNLSIVNRYYFKDKFFFETDVYGNFVSSDRSQSKHYMSNDSLSSFRDKDIETGIELPLKVGFGRLERVSDAAHAVYLLDALEKADRARESLSSRESIFELASLAAELKNKRFFDQRIRRIYELEALDSFLTENEHVSNEDIRYFSNLQDMWLYGGIYSRYSGSRFSVGISPGYTYNFNRYQNNTDTSSQRISLQSAAISAEYDYRKPLNMKWQQDFSASASYTLNKEIIINSSDDSTVFVIPAAEFELREGISYYPNTRSRFSADLGAIYYQNINKSDEDEAINSNNDSGLNSFFRINGSYYISPQLRLSFGYNMYYTMFKVGSVSRRSYDRHNLQQSYGLKLTYSLF